NQRNNSSTKTNATCSRDSCLSNRITQTGRERFSFGLPVVGLNHFRGCPSHRLQQSAAIVVELLTHRTYHLAIAAHARLSPTLKIFHNILPETLFTLHQPVNKFLNRSIDTLSAISNHLSIKFRTDLL